MPVRLFRAALACSVLLAAPRTAAFGQVVPERLGAGATMELYRFSDPGRIGIETLSLFTLPFAGRADVTRRFALSLGGAYARATLSRPDGSESTITGLTDTEVRATFVAGRDRVTFTAIALLPTGHERMTTDESDVAGAIAADVLPFRVTNWGTGGGLGGSVAAAVPVGGFGAGISAGYVVAREFEPIAGDDAFAYRPGNQLHLTAAVDRSFGGSGKLGIRISYLTFDADQANDANLYQAGDRLQATASFGFAAGARSSSIVYAGLLHRADGRFETSSTVLPAQDLLFTGIGMRIPLGAGIVQPGLELRVLDGSDSGGRGYTAGLGASGEFPAGAMTFAPTIRARLGRAEPRDGSSSSFTGAEIGLIIRFGTR